MHVFPAAKVIKIVRIEITENFVAVQSMTTVSVQCIAVTVDVIRVQGK